LDTKYGKIIKARPEINGTTVFCLLPYTKKPSPIEPKSRPQRRDDEVSNAILKRLTVELSDRTMPPDQRRGRTLPPGVRRAQTPRVTARSNVWLAEPVCLHVALKEGKQVDPRHVTV
jgi:hypothetical protein